eukprot:evm.model.scf_1663.1 EVM.evm.TU.scf_1663.1   scf_1663:2467-4272(-)
MAQEDLRSLSSRELLEKRGLTLLVIHPEGETLTLGLGCHLAPVRVAQAVAHRRRRPVAAGASGVSGSLASGGGVGVGPKGDEAAGVSGAPVSGAGVGDGPEENDERLSALRRAAAAIRLEGEVEDMLKRDVRKEGSVAESGESSGESRQVVVGDDVLRLCAGDPYEVAFPIVDGKFDLGGGRTHARARGELAEIWSWAVETRLGVPRVHWRNFSVVLAVSERMDGAEVATLADVALRDMGFGTLAVHAEPVAAAFGNGCGAACVVNVGSAATRLCCVEDGLMIPASRLCLPFGVEDVSEALAWMLAVGGRDRIRGGSEERDRVRGGSEEPGRLPDRGGAAGRAALRRAAMQGCFLPAEGSEALVRHQIAERPPAAAAGLGRLGAAACLAPMGLFFPGVFNVDASRLRPPRVAASDFDESLADRPSGDPANRSIKPEPGHATPGRATPPGSTPEDDDSPTPDPDAPQPADRILNLPLDAAIVRSISTAGRPDLRRRLFGAMLVIGHGADLAGMADMLERRVLAALPPDEPTDTVAVAEAKGPPGEGPWRGGVLLGVLEAGGHWVRREDWVAGGVRVGQPGRLGRSENAAAKLFWFVKAQQGG